MTNSEGVNRESTRFTVEAETVLLSWRASLLRGAWNVMVLNTLMASLITALFALLITCFLLAGLAGVAPNSPGLDPSLAHRLPLRALSFFGFAWCLTSLATVPMSIWYLASDRRGRVVELKNGRLNVHIGFSEWSAAIEDCVFTVTRMGCDGLGFYWPNREYFAISTTTDDPKVVVCGFSDEWFANWREAAAAVGLREYMRPKFSLLQLVAIPTGGVFGLAGGSLAGWTVEVITPLQRLIAAWGFVGALDGVIFTAVAVLLAVRAEGSSKLIRKASIITMPVFLGLLGFKIGMMGGVGAACATALINAAIGVAFIVYVRRFDACE